MREVRLEIGHVELFAWEEGEGPALLFLHGGLANHQAVWPLVGPLADRYRVIMPDLRGSGRSWCSEPLSFARLSDDLLALLDHLRVKEALVGGMSSGSGPAVRFALRHPDRTRALIVVKPVYAGEDSGYTSSQAASFAGMDAVASRATSEGIEVLRSLYDRLPDGIRERAWQIASQFDPGSVVTTSRFIASGVQPFAECQELRNIRVPTLLVRGADDQHPAAVSDVYAACLHECSIVPARDTGIAEALRHFCDVVTTR